MSPSYPGRDVQLSSSLLADRRLRPSTGVAAINTVSGDTGRPRETLLSATGGTVDNGGTGDEETSVRNPSRGE